METIHFLSSLLLFVYLVNGEDPDPSCLQCICQASSNCDTINLKCPSGSGFNSYCGPYQISRYYWEDGNGIGYDFETCTNLKACAERVIINYMKKYARDCNGDGTIDCLDYAAIHRMGADRCSDQSLYSSDYWKVFSQTQCVVNPSIEADPQSPSLYSYQHQEQQQQSNNVYVPKPYPGNNYVHYSPVNAVGVNDTPTLSLQPSSSPTSSSTRRLKKKKKRKNSTNRGSSSRRRIDGNQGRVPSRTTPVSGHFPGPIDPPSTRSGENIPIDRRVDSDDVPGAESSLGVPRTQYEPSYRASSSNGPSFVSIPTRGSDDGYLNDGPSDSVPKPPQTLRQPSTPRTISSYPPSPFDHSPLTPSHSPSYPPALPPSSPPTLDSPSTPNAISSPSIPSSRPSRPTSRSSPRPASRSSPRPSRPSARPSSVSPTPTPSNAPSISSFVFPPEESSPLLPPSYSPSYPPPSHPPSYSPSFDSSYPDAGSYQPSYPSPYEPSSDPSYPPSESLPPISSLPPPSPPSTIPATRSHPTTDSNRRRPPNTTRTTNTRNRPTTTTYQPPIPTQPATVRPPVIIYETPSPSSQPTISTVTNVPLETLRPTIRSSVQPARGVRNGRRRPADDPTTTLNSNYSTNSNQPRTFTQPQPPQPTTEVPTSSRRVTTRLSEPTAPSNPRTITESGPEGGLTSASSGPTLEFRNDFDTTNNDESILPSNPRPPHLTNTTITISDQCLSCLCESTESCSNKGTCTNPEGPCGPLRVTHDQWVIAGKPKTNFQKCASSLDCSRGILRRYYAKHGVDCNLDSDINCVDFALIHKYGLDNCKTIPDDLFKSGYWLNFENCYGFDRK